jgi:hypothetical protein
VFKKEMFSPRKPGASLMQREAPGFLGENTIFVVKRGDREKTDGRKEREKMDGGKTDGRKDR